MNFFKSNYKYKAGEKPCKFKNKNNNNNALIIRI